MNTRTFFPVFIALAVATGPQAFAQAPAEQAQMDDAGRCAAAAQQAKSQAKRHAILGFARTLAGNLPMVRAGGMIAAVAGQAAGSALDVAASTAGQPVATCAAE